MIVLIESVLMLPFHIANGLASSCVDGSLNGTPRGLRCYGDYPEDAQKEQNLAEMSGSFSAETLNLFLDHQVQEEESHLYSV